MVKMAGQSSSSCDAIILCGGKQPNLGLDVDNKNMAIFRGEPLFLHTLRAVLATSRFGRVYLVGQKQPLDEWLKKAGLHGKQARVEALEECSNIVENSWMAFIHSINGYIDGDELRSEQLKNRQIFICSGDIPIATKWELEQFLDRCESAGRFGWCMGATEEQKLLPYGSHDGCSGVDFAYSHFAEGLYRINNLHLFRPFLISKRHEFHEFYKVRYLKSFINVLKSGIGIIKRGVDMDGFMGWLEMLAAMGCRRVGLHKLSRWITDYVSIARGESVVGKLMGTSCKLIPTDYGGSAIDIDRQGNLQTFEQNYDRWMQHQHSIYKRLNRL